MVKTITFCLSFAILKETCICETEVFLVPGDDVIEATIAALF